MSLFDRILLLEKEISRVKRQICCSSSSSSATRFGVTGEDVNNGTVNRKFSISPDTLFDIVDAQTDGNLKFEMTANASGYSDLYLQTGDLSNLSSLYSYIDIYTNAGGSSAGVDLYVGGTGTENKDVEFTLYKGQIYLYLDANSKFTLDGVTVDNAVTQVLGVTAAGDVKKVDVSALSGSGSSPLFAIANTAEAVPAGSPLTASTQLVITGVPPGEYELYMDLFLQTGFDNTGMEIQIDKAPVDNQRLIYTFMNLIDNVSIYRYANYGASPFPIINPSGGGVLNGASQEAVLQIRGYMNFNATDSIGIKIRPIGGASGSAYIGNTSIIKLNKLN